MDTLYTLLLAVGIVLLLVLLFFIYSGLLHSIDIERVDSPYPALVIAYKFSTGPYQNCGSVFQATTNLAPKTKCIGIYYDDPETVASKDLRWAVGCVLAEDRAEPDRELSKVLTQNGYTIKSLPKVKKVVRTWFPFRTRLSIFLAIARVWKALGTYIKDSQNMLNFQKTDCEAHPWLELYTGNEIHFIGILDQHDAYIVREAKEMEENMKKEEAK